jgi:hypothetical protein
VSAKRKNGLGRAESQMLFIERRRVGLHSLPLRRFPSKHLHWSALGTAVLLDSDSQASHFKQVILNTLAEWQRGALRERNVLYKPPWLAVVLYDGSGSKLTFMASFNALTPKGLALSFPVAALPLCLAPGLLLCERLVACGPLFPRTFLWRGRSCW